MDKNNFAMSSCSMFKLKDEKRVEPHPHHLKAAICTTRAKYRQGRKDTAVKVYAISQESYYILLQNVPSIDISEELQKLCETFGKVEIFIRIPDYPREDFTDVYLVKFQKIQEARSLNSKNSSILNANDVYWPRVSKKQLDERSFFGGCLHVCYAPECESINETREKLNERKRIVAARIKMIKNPTSSGNYINKSYPQHTANLQVLATTSNHTIEHDATKSSNLIGPIKPNLPSLPIESDSIQNETNSPKDTYIWAGKEYPVQSDAATNHLNTSVKKKIVYKTIGRTLVPRQIMTKKEIHESKSFLATRKRIADKILSITPINPEVKLRKKT